MAYLRLLWNESRQDCIRLIAVNVFSGLLQAALAAIIIFSAGAAASAAGVEKMGSYLAYLHKDNIAQTSFYLVLFVISIVAFLLSRRFVMIHTGELAERIIAKTRIRIIDKIRQSNLLLYERVGKPHIYSALQESTMTLSVSANQIATGFSSAIMLFFTIGYIGYLSLPAFVLTLITISAGVLMYMRRIKVLTEETEKSTAKEREFLACLDHFLDGFKEVKMHESRSQDLYENYLAKIVQKAEEVKNQTTRHFAQMMLFAQTFFYFLLATVIFILPSYDPKRVGKHRHNRGAYPFYHGSAWGPYRRLPARFAKQRCRCEYRSA